METNASQSNSPMAATPIIPRTGSPKAPNTAPIVPLGAKIISILFYITSIFLIFVGVILAVLSSVSLQFLGNFGLTAGLVPGILTIIWGVFSFFAGRGLWGGKQWGKILAITISNLYFVFAVIALIQSSGTNYVSMAINIIIVGYLIFSKKVKASFTSTEPMSKAVILAIFAIVVYAILQYPAIASMSRQAQNTVPTSQTTQNNPQTSGNTYTPDPTYGPVVQPLTPAGIYSNSTDGFQISLPFSYFVQETQNPSGNGILISGAQTAMILIGTEPTTLSLQDEIKKSQGDLVSNDTLTNATIAGEPAIEDTGDPTASNPVPNSSVNIYFLIHNGTFYMLKKTGSFKTGQVITDDQFNSAIQSLQFTK